MARVQRRNLVLSSDEKIIKNDYTISLDPAPSTNLTSSGDIIPMQVDDAGAAFGSALYIASDGHLEKAKANALTTMPCYALALESGAGSKQVLLKGFIRNDSWTWTPGGVIYISAATAGLLTQTAPVGSGNQVQIAGVAISATILFFNPGYLLLEIT